MTLVFKDASDFKGWTVNQNLVNQVSNMDRVADYKDINVSNHANAFNKKATGFEVWYYAGDAIGKELAEKVSKAGAEALGIVNRGAKPTTNLYVISQSKGHTILIEWFFIDNPNDVKKWNQNKQKAIAAVMKVFEGYPNYTFASSHGGHYGFNLMDPGAVGNGLKEAVVMQEVNKAILGYKKQEDKPVVKVNDRPTHSIYTGNFEVDSRGYKKTKEFLTANKWNFKEEKQKDGRVRFRTGRFNQNSAGKFRLEKWLAENNYSYVVNIMV